MFKQKLIDLCHEADWIVQCGGTLNGYRARYTHDAVAIWDADIDALYTYARAVVAAGRRSSVASHRAIADALATVIDQYSTYDLIDTFKDII